MCHEAYEESLAKSDINLQQFVSNSTTTIPIVHAEVNFYRPMFCGNELIIELTPELLNESEFNIFYEIMATVNRGETLAKAQTKHVCINPKERKKKPLPDIIGQWLRCYP
jgi:1,4-dihydroxy-2-naphthoyl-CoA hydrolase